MTKQKTIDNYLEQADWKIRENSNMTFSLQGLNVYLTEAAISEYWLDKVYPKDIREAHEGGDFHIHDLGTLGAYCVGWDLMDLLTKGFKGVRGKIESKPAKHFRVALLHIVNFMYTLQGESAGAQAFSNVDTLLAPFIRTDGLTYDELKQNMQEFIFNMNVPTRTGGQTPFTNFTMDLTIPDHLKNLPAIVGGKVCDFTYGDLQDEVDLFNMAFAEIMLEGDANGRPFTFPIPTYNLTEDFDWDNPVYSPIWEMTSKYGIPYFANFINSDMDPGDVRSMCCRLMIKNGDLYKRGGGLFGANPKTGSIGVVTINLPRIGYVADDEEEFLDILTGLMWQAKDSLEIKREFIEDLTDKGLYPYSAFYLRDIKDGGEGYWHNHFSTIGIIGMNDAVYNLFGEDITTNKGSAFAERVLDSMRTVISLLQHNTGNLYNLEATPAEGACFKLALKDIERYPDIKFYNIDKANGSAPYYTNSSQLPASCDMHLFDAMDHQDKLQTMYTGGTVFHALLGESAPDIESLKELIKTIAYNYHMPYFSITPTFSICEDHGYINGEHLFCPTCGKRSEVYSRVVGYIRPIEQWNDGKVAEFFERTTYDISGEKS